MRGTIGFSKERKEIGSALTLSEERRKIGFPRGNAFRKGGSGKYVDSTVELVFLSNS